LRPVSAATRAAASSATDSCPAPRRCCMDGAPPTPAAAAAAAATEAAPVVCRRPCSAVSVSRPHAGPAAAGCASCMTHTSPSSSSTISITSSARPCSAAPPPLAAGADARALLLSWPLPMPSRLLLLLPSRLPRLLAGEMYARAAFELDWRHPALKSATTACSSTGTAEVCGAADSHSGSRTPTSCPANSCRNPNTEASSTAARICVCADVRARRSRRARSCRACKISDRPAIWQ